MKDQYTANEIRGLLTPRDTPAPPENLLERIRAEIPDELELPPAAFPRRSSRPGRLSWRAYALAASLLVTAGAAFVVLRVNQALDPTLAPASEEAVSADLAGEEAVFSDDSSSLRSDETARSGPREILATRDNDAPVAKQEIPKPAPAPSAPELSVVGRDSAEGAEKAKRKKLEEAMLEFRAAESAPPRRQRTATARPAEAKEQAAAPVREEELRAVDYLADAATASGAAGQRTDSRRFEASGRLAPSSRLAPEQPRVAPAVAPPSTGGTAEPNDAPYGDVFFHDYGTNPFIDTEDDRLSTFGLDVDTASYTVVRRFLRDGHLPEPAAVRVEELINYFDYGDAPPEEEEFRIHAQGAPSPFAEGERYHLLRFHLRGRDLADEDRRPADLVFVVDVSGSMARENRLGLVKDALGLLLDELRPDDRVALVIYGSSGQVIQPYTTERGLLRRAIDRLVPGGSTNAAEGLDLAYELAARDRRRGTISRVILCSDGVANVGATSAEAILERVRRHAERGVELTTVGFGMGNYNDILMERLADSGNGRYAYVDQLDEAERIFVENLTGTLQTLAAEARVQVEWNEDLVSRYRLIGYENRDIADERFRDDTVDAGEIGAGHAVTALYEIKLHRELRPRDRVATLHLRYGSVISGEMVELERRVSGRDFAPRFEDASAALRLTSLVAEFGEILSHSYWAREGDLDEVFRRAQRLSPEFSGDADVAEFVSLVGKAARLAE